MVFWVAGLSVFMDGDDPVEVARFLRFLDLTPILAVLEGFYCEP